MTDLARVEINGESIDIGTHVSDDVKTVSYTFTASKPIEPHTLVILLRTLEMDICKEFDMTIDARPILEDTPEGQPN